MEEAERQWPAAIYPRQQEIINAYFASTNGASSDCDSIRALKTRWNTTVPVARLPTELLLLIFEEWACECYTDVQKTQPTFRPYAWIRCTHVCKRWREVAFSCPCLWRRIVPASPEWTQELLTRSKQTALFVNFNSCDTKSSWLASQVRTEGTHHLLRHQFHRMYDVHMDAFDTENPTDITAPLLTTLQVAGFYENPISAFLFRNNVASESSGGSWVFAPDGLPSLKTLRVFIASRSIAWACLRPTLQSLKTRCIRPRPSPAAWLTALSDMPNLRSLDIELGDMSPEANIPEWNPPNSVSGPVTLPALKSLYITDECDGRSTVQLLNGLVLPGVEHVHIELFSARCEMESKTHFTSILKALGPLHRGYKLDSLRLEVREGLNAVEITLGPLVVTAENTYPPSVESTWKEGMTHVQLSVYADLMRGVMREYLRAMQDVRVLQVGGDLRKVTSFLKLLQPLSRRTAQDESRSAPIFPRLHILRLLGMVWKPKDDGEDEDDEGCDSDDDPFEQDAIDLMRQASKVLDSRKKAGFEIGYIVLADQLNELLTREQ